MLVPVTHTEAELPNAMSTPLVVKPKISHLSTINAAPARKRMPLIPVPMPLILRLRKITTSLGPAWTTIPLVPETRTEATWPPPPSMVIPFVMVTAPYPAGSRASISPPAAVLEMAPAKVLQGAVRLQGLASSPTPETQVRLAWPCINKLPQATNVKMVNILVFMVELLFFLVVFIGSTAT